MVLIMKKLVHTQFIIRLADFVDKKSGPHLTSEPKSIHAKIVNLEKRFS
jgi:hypothetical protein